MTDNKATQELLASLMEATSQAQVMNLLRRAGFWTDVAAWRPYGDNENNYSTAGNQQGNPDAALVEKIINSVDAVLMGKALEAGIDIRGSLAPKSPREAVAIYFDGIEPANVQDHQGYMADWTPTRRTEVARAITVALTGERNVEPTISIADAGEGQAPENMPDTILSLMKGIKKGVPFVQGKFNMGGTGALRFSGDDSIQFVLSKRNPKLARAEGVSTDWGFTVVRRDRPGPDTKMSVYRYLAPVGSGANPGHGELLRVSDLELPIFPAGQDVHARNSEWGTLIKLFDYQTRARTSFFRDDGLLGRLDIMMPGLILPVRLHECRPYGGKQGSFETTLTGLEVRLRGQEGGSGNLELPPHSAEITVGGETVRVTIYAFKKGKQGTYRKNEGVLFLVNGQTHGTLNDRYFTRKAVGMDYIAQSLLVVVDCSDLADGTKEDLFMNSRDRLSTGPLARQLEVDLAEILKSDPTLQTLIAKRREADTAEKLANSKPLEDVLRSIFRKSPALAKLFLPGLRLSNPFSSAAVPTAKAFKGTKHPTYFRFRGLAAEKILKRTAHLGQRFRIALETDVENDYFRRHAHAGQLVLAAVVKGKSVAIAASTLNLHDGLAQLTLHLPKSVEVGDALELTIEVSDDTLVSPFINVVELTIAAPVKPASGPPGQRRTNPPKGDDDKALRPSGITFPEVYEVKESDWEAHEMTADSAIRMKRRDVEGGEEITFYLNVDNRFFKAEVAGSRRDGKLLHAQYNYGMTLAGLGAMRLAEGLATSRDGESEEDDDAVTAQELVAYVTDGVAPILLPMIDELGALDPSDLDAASPDEDLSQDVG